MTKSRLCIESKQYPDMTQDTNIFFYLKSNDCQCLLEVQFHLPLQFTVPFPNNLGMENSVVL